MFALIAHLFTSLFGPKIGGTPTLNCNSAYYAKSGRVSSSFSVLSVPRVKPKSCAYGQCALQPMVLQLIHLSFKSRASLS